MSLSRNRGAALRGLLIGCCAAAATTAALIAGPVPASGAVPLPGSAAVPAAVPAKAAGAAGGAVDTTPPSEPGMIGSANVYNNTTLGLLWSPSTDDTGVVGYEIYTWTYTSPESVTFTRGPVWIISSTPEQIFGYTAGLVPNREYLAYVVAVDAAGNRSVPSLMATGRAMAEPPIVSPTPTPLPPVPPAENLRAGAGPSPGYASLTWTSGEGTGPDLGWMVFRRSSSEWNFTGHTSVPRATVQIGDDPSYTFQVVPRDVHGRFGRPSNAATYPAPPSSPPTCAVTYKDTTWSSGFTASVTIKNVGTTTIDGWRLQFSFRAAGQRVTRGWSAVWTQSGTTVTATATNWNKVIKPGKSQIIGFTGTHTGSTPPPDSFTLNGKPCTAG
ncbi:cellulose-binding domain-containing protein [Sphaerisporangium sp. B11E5]|uniref:cellulose-binding domain-containing protein n=1 Tax=Sphaerisporangium sp. B11E5 TaxID=3153563 RepID=UPI00325ED8D8